MDCGDCLVAADSEGGHCHEEHRISSYVRVEKFDYVMTRYTLYQGCGSAFIFLRIRIQLFFSMRIRIQQLKKCESGSSLTKFVSNYFMKCWNRQKDCSKVINNGVCPHLVNRYFLIKLQFSSIFLAFFLFFPSNFPLLDPDPQPWV